jgi:hypothetical protein
VITGQAWSESLETKKAFQWPTKGSDNNWLEVDGRQSRSPTYIYPVLFLLFHLYSKPWIDGEFPQGNLFWYFEGAIDSILPWNLSAVSKTIDTL